MVAAASSRRVVVAVITVISVLFRTKGSALNRIVIACFIVKLVAHMVNRESYSLLEIRATIASVAQVGVLNSEDELVYLALS
jgi:hypothetical protein